MKLSDVKPLVPELPDEQRVVITIFSEYQMQVYLSRLANPHPAFEAWKFLGDSLDENCNPLFN